MSLPTRTVGWAAAVAVLAVVAGGVATWAVRDRARDARLAEARALAARSLAVREVHPVAALLLAVEALRTADGAEPVAYEVREALIAAAGRLGQTRAILRGHDAPVTAVAFSADATKLASSDAGGRICIWRLKLRRRIACMQSHEGAVAALSWAPDGSSLASAGDDGVIRVWRVGHRSRPLVVGRHRGAVALVAFSPDGTTLATGGDVWVREPADLDATVRLWNVEQQRQVGETLHVAPAALRFSREGRRLHVVSVVGRITHHDADVPRAFREPDWDTGYTEYGLAALSADGRWVALDGEGGFALWRLRGTTPEPEAAVAAAVRKSPTALGATASHVGLGTETGHVRLLALDDPPWIEAELRFGSASVTALALRRPTEPFALGDAGGVVWVGERKSSLIRKTKLSGTIDDKGARPQSQDGELTAHIEGAFDEPNRVKILDRRGRQHGATVKTFGRLVAFHPDGRRVAVVDRRGRLRLWDFERNRWHGATFPRGFPPRETDLLAFSADGSIVAAATEDTLSFHDVDRWAPLGQVTLANFGPLRLSFDPARGAFSLVSASTYSLYEDDTTEYSDLALEAVEPILFSDDPARWRRYACRLVRRSLTTTEWDRYVPGRPYRRTCQ